MSTTTKPMMKCGHAANAVRVLLDGTTIPSCAICAPSASASIVDDAPPDLTGRTAKCTCGASAPSSPALAFFEYRGPGAGRATCAVGDCIFLESVHQPINPHTGRPGVTDHTFVARTYDFDSFYCGCRGWD